MIKKMIPQLTNFDLGGKFTFLYVRYLSHSLQINADWNVFALLKSETNNFKISSHLPDKLKQHNTNTHENLMILIILIGRKTCRY